MSRYPSSADLSRLRLEIAIENPRTRPLAQARLDRGQSFGGPDRKPGVLGHSATPEECRNGIGYSETIARRELAEARRLVRSGLCFPG
jgi:hypothetical protein